MSLYQLSIENLFTTSFLWRSRYIWFEILPLKIVIWRKWWLEIWDLAKWFKPVLERFVRVCVCQMMIVVMLGVQWKFSWKRFSAACPTASAENSSTKSVVVCHLSHTNSACSCFVLPHTCVLFIQRVSLVNVGCHVMMCFTHWLNLELAMWQCYSLEDMLVYVDWTHWVGVLLAYGIIDYLF